VVAKVFWGCCILFSKEFVCGYCCCYVVAVVFWPIARALLRWLFADNHVVAKFIGVVSRVLPYVLLSSFYVYSGWLQ